MTGQHSFSAPPQRAVRPAEHDRGHERRLGTALQLGAPPVIDLIPESVTVAPPQSFEATYPTRFDPDPMINILAASGNPCNYVGLAAQNFPQ